MNTTLSSIEPSKLLSTERIWNILADQDETCDERRVCYYPNIETLARQVRSSKCWTMGEVFVYVESAHRFIVMKQIAPSSCEMLTISNAGYCDVLTAYRYSQDDLVAQFNDYMNRICHEGTRHDAVTN